MSSDSNASIAANLKELQRRLMAQPGPPPLRIHHLMACAAVAAVQLAMWRTNLAGYSGGSLISVTLSGTNQVLSAIGLTLAGFSIYWWRKGYAALSQPGQVMLLVYALGALASWLRLATVLLIGSNWQSIFPSPRSSSDLFFLFQIGLVAIYYLTPLVFFVWCAWRIADTIPWRVTFIVRAVAPFLTEVFSGFLFRVFAPSSGWQYWMLINLSSALLIGVFEVWAVANDMAAKRERYWTHWVGVGLSLLAYGAVIVGNMLLWLISL
jgi:hypothetical protein